MGWRGEGRQHTESTLVPNPKCYRTVPPLEAQLSEKLSLRGLARALGYSVATLSEHRNAGIFGQLPDGLYDLETVKRRLLASTSPNAKHRVRLEPKKGTNRTRTDRTWEQWARELEAEPDVTLAPTQEAGVQAAMAHLRSGKFEQAINGLCDLPIEMARAMVKADPKVSFTGAVAYFENLIAGNLRWAFEMARKDVLK